MNELPSMRVWVWTGLVVLLSFHAWLAFDWLDASSEPLFWDSAEHANKVTKVQHNLYRSEPPMRGKILPQPVLAFSTEYPVLARAALAPVAGLANLVESLYLGSARPPLSYWPSALLLGSSDASSDGISAAHGLAWFFVLIWVTYLLGSELSDRWTGFLSAALVSGYPMFVGQARVPMLDIPLAAATAFALWAFLRSSEFRDRRWALIFGASCGAGLLIKQSFPIGLALPVAWVVGSMARQWWKAAGDPSSELIERATNLGRSLFGLALVAGPWYVVNAPSTLRFLFMSRGRAALEGDPASLSVDGLLLYPLVYFDVALGSIFTLGAIAGLLVLIFRGGARERQTIGLGILGLVVVFAFLYANKDARYIAPTLPLLAVVTAMAVARIRFTTLRRLAFVLLVAVAILTSIASTRISLIPQSEVPSSAWLNSLFEFRSFYAHLPRRANWRADSILETVRGHRGDEPGRIGLLVVDGGIYMRAGLALAEERNRLRLRDRIPVQYVESYGEEEPGRDAGRFYILLERDRNLPAEGGQSNRALLDVRGFEVSKLDSLLRVEALPRGRSAELFFYQGGGGER